jgi:hypothetical protein
VVNTAEAETVRTIFRRYLELKSFSRLVADLDKRGIVTKRRNTKVAKYQGGIPFTYGPLAYVLKNRIYLGEMHHGDKWFKGEHAAIVDSRTFQQVQALLKSNAVTCKTKYSESGALLQGKLYDDKGNRMGPSFSSKNGVRYRFYISTALRGRKHKAGSIARIAARDIEELVEEAVRKYFTSADASDHAVAERIERVVIGKSLVRITFKFEDQADGSSTKTLETPWDPTKASRTHLPPPPSDGNPDQKLLQAVVRAHAWLVDLQNGRFRTIEELATTAKIHPKVARQALRLAFLAPEVTSSILRGERPEALRQMQRQLPLAWAAHQQLLG